MSNPLQFLGLIAGGSAGMAQFYRQTKSWMIVALTHAVISVNLPILIIFLVVTIGLLKFHETKIKKANTNSEDRLDRQNLNYKANKDTTANIKSYSRKPPN